MKPPLADPAAGLDLIKPSVRGQAAYALKVREAPRKLNQNESPYDVPPELKREILERMAAAPWHRYPEFVPARLLERLSARYDWPAIGERFSAVLQSVAEKKSFALRALPGSWAKRKA